MFCFFFLLCCCFSAFILLECPWVSFWNVCGAFHSLVSLFALGRTRCFPTQGKEAKNIQRKEKTPSTPPKGCSLEVFCYVKLSKHTQHSGCWQLMQFLRTKTCRKFHLPLGSTKKNGTKTLCSSSKTGLLDVFYLTTRLLVWNDFAGSALVPSMCLALLFRPKTQ